MEVDRAGRFWDEPAHAAIYDKEFQGIIGAYVDRTEVDAVLDEVPLRPGMFLLDAGCGTGRHLAKIPPGVKYVGVDASLPMLQIAKSRNRSETTYFVAADVTQLPFKPGTFDAAISVRVLQHLVDQAEAIRQFGLVARPRATVCVLSYNSWTLHCLEKCLRHSKLAALLTRLFRALLGPNSTSRLTRMHRDYPNDFNSSPELARFFNQAGLHVMKRKGSNLSGVWVVTDHWLAGFVERAAPEILKRYLRWCDRIEAGLASRSPFNLFMDKVIVSGTKQ